MIFVTACGVAPQNTPAPAATSASVIPATESISEATTEAAPQQIAEPVSMETVTQPVTDNPPDDITIGHEVTEMSFVRSRISIAREPNSKLYGITGLSGAVNLNVGDDLCMSTNSMSITCGLAESDGSFKFIFDAWPGDEIKLWIDGFLAEGQNLITLFVADEPPDEPVQDSSTIDLAF